MIQVQIIMKRTLLILTLAAFIASCSAPQYTYNFDHYNYHAGKKTESAKVETIADQGPPAIQPESLSASSEIEVIEPAISLIEKKPGEQVNLSKSQRNDLKKTIRTIKKDSKAEKKNIKSSQSTSALDHDLKLAAVFGAVGVVGIILGSLASVFSVIGGISLLIGVVFFVIWLTKQ